MSQNSDSPMIAIIVAMAENRVIGCNNQLPWHLPNDLRYFKANTMGKPIVMGRKTYESIGKPLPGRTNIVVSRNGDFEADGVYVAGSLNDAVAVATQQAKRDGVDELMVIGGAELYVQALPMAGRLYITQVHADVAGDAYFPQLDWSHWREVSRDSYDADAANTYPHSFTVFQRI